MNIDPTVGTVTIFAHVITVLCLTLSALKQKNTVIILFLTGYIFLGVPIFVRMIYGDAYTMEGARIYTVSYIVSRLAYVAAYTCFAVASFFSLRAAIRGAEKARK